MMKVIVGITESKGLVKISKPTFNALFEPEWLEDDFVKQMVLDVDNSVVQGPYCIMSPVLGQISPERMSGGVKGLILIYKCKEFRKYLSTMFGENCVPWLERLSKMVDFDLYMIHPLEFEGNTPIDAIGEDGEKLVVSEDVFRYYINKAAEYGPKYDEYGDKIEEAIRVW